MDEDLIIGLVMCMFAFWFGIFVGAIGTEDITELENECIVYENNVYCKEVAE